MSKDSELRESRLVFYRNDLGKIDRVLQEFVRLSGSSSVLLVDKEGHMITRAGKVPSFDQTRSSACCRTEQVFSSTTEASASLRAGS